MAESQSTLMARHLRVSPEDLQRYQQLGSHMLYPNPRFRGPRVCASAATGCGQSGLWGHGISGDLPILLVTIGDLRDAPLVREALLAHTYWRLHGFKSDLVILDEEAAGYEQPLRDSLRSIIQSQTQYTGIDQPGGVFLRAAKQLPPEDLTLLMASARVMLIAARGSLAQQLTACSGDPPCAARDASSPPCGGRAITTPAIHGASILQRLRWLHPRRARVRDYLSPETSTPAPWVNVMANPTFGAMVSESGARICVVWEQPDEPADSLVQRPSDRSHRRRPSTFGTTSWGCTGRQRLRRFASWMLTEPGTARAIRVFEHNSHAIDQELLTFVPMDEPGGSPVSVSRLRLRNRLGSQAHSSHHLLRRVGAGWNA